jgi:hypothetical protein
MEVVVTGHNFESILPKDHPCHVCFKLADWFQKRRLLSNFPIGHRPSVNTSHFNLLLRNHWANCNQTLVEWSLDGPFPKLCPMIPTYNQDGHQAKNGVGERKMWQLWKDIRFKGEILRQKEL